MEQGNISGLSVGEFSGMMSGIIHSEISKILGADTVGILKKFALEKKQELDNQRFLTVTQISEKLLIPRQSFYNWLKDSEKLKLLQKISQYNSRGKTYHFICLVMIIDLRRELFRYENETSLDTILSGFKVENPTDYEYYLIRSKAICGQLLNYGEKEYYLNECTRRGEVIL